MAALRLTLGEGVPRLPIGDVLGGVAGVVVCRRGIRPLPVRIHLLSLVVVSMVLADEDNGSIIRLYHCRSKREDV